MYLCRTIETDLIIFPFRKFSQNFVMLFVKLFRLSHAIPWDGSVCLENLAVIVSSIELSDFKTKKKGNEKETRTVVLWTSAVLRCY